MKKFLFFTGLLLSINSFSQEFRTFESISIAPLEVTPGLSFPLRQLPEFKFSLKAISFDKKEEKRQVNLIALMERKRYEKEQALVEMESPMPSLSAGEKALIQVTNDIRVHDRSSNFDIYTGQKKIPAYEEMQTPLLRQSFTPYSRRGYVSPGFYYNPYLR